MKTSFWTWARQLAQGAPSSAQRLLVSRPRVAGSPLVLVEAAAARKSHIGRVPASCLELDCCLHSK
jgi:hypothetical protein